MNYVKHLNNWFDLIIANQEVKPTHITLYFVLFQLWNTSRFADSFSINRHEMINLSKLGSKSTYSRCMNDLHRWGWIKYEPSTSKYGVSTISMYKWVDIPTKEELGNTAFTDEGKRASRVKTRTSNETSNDPSSASSTAPTSNPSSESSSGQEVGHIIKHINDKPQTDNSKNLNNDNFKSKFHEPL